MHTVQPEYVINREVIFLLNENYSKSLKLGGLKCMGKTDTARSDVKSRWLLNRNLLRLTASEGFWGTL